MFHFPEDDERQMAGGFIFPLETQYESMQVTFLGTNGWFDTSAGNTVSVLVRAEEYDIIFDAGKSSNSAN